MRCHPLVHFRGINHLAPQQVLIRSVILRRFRNYERAAVQFEPGINLLYGQNGVGKTNLLEALYFGCIGRSCRTNVDGRMIAFKETVARVELSGTSESGDHTLAAAIDRSSGKVFSADGAPVERIDEVEFRPLVTVFMPDRLVLIKGAPGARRAHIDQFVTALWPARRAVQRSYGQLLAQRNTLLSRGSPSDLELDSWDTELARVGIELIENRCAALELIADRFNECADRLGLPGDATITYRPSVKETTADDFAAALGSRRLAEVERGFSSYGPHRDEFVFRVGGVDLRNYGSQGQQRIALLALLLAERDAIIDQRGIQPLTLLDDVMSELDSRRRESLLEAVSQGGQTVITATEADQVPGDINAIEIESESGVVFSQSGSPVNGDYERDEA